MLAVRKHRNLMLYQNWTLLVSHIHAYQFVIFLAMEDYYQRFDAHCYHFLQRFCEHIMTNETMPAGLGGGGGCGTFQVFLSRPVIEIKIQMLKLDTMHYIW